MSQRVSQAAVDLCNDSVLHKGRARRIPLVEEGEIVVAEASTTHGRKIVWTHLASDSPSGRVYCGGLLTCESGGAAGRSQNTGTWYCVKCASQNKDNAKNVLASQFGRRSSLKIPEALLRKLLDKPLIRREKYLEVVDGGMQFYIDDYMKGGAVLPWSGNERRAGTDRRRLLQGERLLIRKQREKIAYQARELVTLRAELRELKGEKPKLEKRSKLEFFDGNKVRRSWAPGPKVGQVIEMAADSIVARAVKLEAHHVSNSGVYCGGAISYRHRVFTTFKGKKQRIYFFACEKCGETFPGRRLQLEVDAVMEITEKGEPK